MFSRRNMEEFMRDLEEDPEMRSQIDLFRVSGVSAPEEEMADVDEEEDFPEVQLSELVNGIQSMTL
jgi:hypothetical protein